MISWLSKLMSKFKVVCVFEKIIRVGFLSGCFNVIKNGKRDRVRFVSKSGQRNQNKLKKKTFSDLDWPALLAIKKNDYRRNTRASAWMQAREIFLNASRWKIYVSKPEEVKNPFDKLLPARESKPFILDCFVFFRIISNVVFLNRLLDLSFFRHVN